MTFRAKPVVKRTRGGLGTRERRNVYLNVAFGLVVLVAIAILAVAAGATWYDQHLSAVASVNGQAITKDEFNARAKVDAWRLDTATRRLNTEHAAGHLTDADWQSQISQVDQARTSLAQSTYERLIDTRVQAILGTQEGIAITPQQIDEQITKEATSPEQRHAWAIEVAPKADTNKDPTQVQKAAAKATADKALADLAAGKTWDVVAKSVATATGDTTSTDLSWITADNTSLDPALLAAVMKLDKDGHTGVIEGEDGTFRIGRVTEIVPSSFESGYRQQITDAGISLDAYGIVVKADLIQTALQDKIKAQALAPGTQRRVGEIFIQAPQSATGAAAAEPAPGSVKVRHILYSPKDNPQGAAALAKDDPAWKKAEADARAAYAKLKADPSLFDATARKDSDETGDDKTGGKLPYFDPGMVSSGQLDAAFGAAIFKAGLKPGDILEPVRSAFGWHVIQVMYFPPDVDEAKKLKSEAEGGADWATLARNFSDAPDASTGGELGWIAKYQLDQASNDAIFGTAVGKVTDPVVVAADGVHIYKILEEATRTPSGVQKTTLEQQAFGNWYSGKKAGFKITRDLNLSSTG
jgi:PPIC-type peptidyl-prolyl cis-trans isomerase-like protein/parvulin-like peptidyl-prolyl cis-trans isomerase-like protein